MAQSLVLPFLDTLGNAEKEAMAGIIYEVIRFKGKKPGEKIYTSEFVEATERMRDQNRLPTVYKLQNSNCWTAFWEMVDEGLIVAHQREDGEVEESWMIVTDDLAKLVSSETPVEVKREILARAETNKKIAEERKTAKREEERIAAEQERKKNSFYNKIKSYIPFLP